MYLLKSRLYIHLHVKIAFVNSIIFVVRAEVISRGLRLSGPDRGCNLSGAEVHEAASSKLVKPWKLQMSQVPFLSELDRCLHEHVQLTVAKHKETSFMPHCKGDLRSDIKVIGKCSKPTCQSRFMGYNYMCIMCQNFLKSP